MTPFRAWAPSSETRISMITSSPVAPSKVRFFVPCVRASEWSSISTVGHLPFVFAWAQKPIWEHPDSNRPTPATCNTHRAAPRAECHTAHLAMRRQRVSLNPLRFANSPVVHPAAIARRDNYPPTRNTHSTMTSEETWPVRQLTKN